MTYASVEPRKKREPGHLALIVALAVEIVWSLYGFGMAAQRLASQDLATSFGQILGASLFMMVPVWVVAYLGFTRRSAPERGVPYALILLVVPVLLQAGLAIALRSASAHQQAQQRVATADIERALNALVHPRPGAPPVDTRPVATGETGEVERLAKIEIAGLQEDQTKYRSEMIATGFQDALKPEQLTGDPGLRAARADLAKAQAIAKEYRARSDWRAAEFRRSIKSSALSPDAKREMLASFDATEPEQHAHAYWDLEDAILVEMDATAADLQHPRGRWIVRGHKVLFSSPADLVTYQEHMAKLRAIQDQETGLRNARLQETSGDLRTLKRAAE